MEKQPWSARVIEGETPAWLKVVAPSMHLALFLLMPAVGVLILLQSMDELDAGPVPDTVVQTGVMLLCLGSVAAVLSGVSLVWALWRKRARLARSYCLAWTFLFVVFFIHIFALMLLTAGAHPPDGGVMLAVLMILPVPLALILSTAVGVVPGIVLWWWTAPRR